MVKINTRKKLKRIENEYFGKRKLPKPKRSKKNRNNNNNNKNSKSKIRSKKRKGGSKKSKKKKMEQVGGMLIGDRALPGMKISAF